MTTRDIVSFLKRLDGTIDIPQKIKIDEIRELATRLSPDPGRFPYDPCLVGKTIAQIKEMLRNLENPIEAPRKLKIDELRKFATEKLQEQDLDSGSELTAISDRATSDSESGSEDEDIKPVKDTRTGGRVPTSSPPAQELTSGSPSCYRDDTISTPVSGSTCGPRTRSSARFKTPEKGDTISTPVPGSTRGPHTRSGGRFKAPEKGKSVDVSPASNPTPTKCPAPKPAKPVTQHKPAKQPPGEPQREVNKSPHLWHPGMPLIFSTPRQDEVPAASCSMPHPPATTSKNVSIIDSPVGRTKSEPLTPSKLQDRSPVASSSKKSSGRISPILIDIISSKIPSDAAHLAIKPDLFQSDDMQILTTINFSKSLPDNANSSVNDTAPAIYMDVPLDAVNVPISPSNANCSMTHIPSDIYSNAPLEMCNIPLLHSILPVKSVSLLPQKKNSLKVQDNQLCESKRNGTISESIVPMEVDTDYHKAPIEDPIEEPGPRTSPPPPFVPLTSITPLQQQPESQLPPAPPTTHFGSTTFEFWVPAYTRPVDFKQVGCSTPEQTEAFKTGKPSVWDRPSIKAEENTPALETAPAAPQLPEAGSKLPTVNEEEDSSSPPLPKAEDDPTAPPQLPGAVSELPTVDEEQALSSPPFPKADDGAPAPPQLPGTVLKLPTAVEEHVPSSPPLPKAKDDAPAPPQLPEAASTLPTADKGDTPSSPPLSKAKDDPPALPQLPELPTVDKEEALSSPPFPKADDGAPALPQLPGAVSELPTAVEEHTPSSPPLPKVEDDPPALPQLPGSVSELPAVVEEDAPSSLPLPKAEDDAPDTSTAPALPQLTEASLELLIAAKQDVYFSPSLPRAEDDASGSDSTTAPAANLHFEPCLSPSTTVMESADQSIPETYHPLGDSPSIRAVHASPAFLASLSNSLADDSEDEIL
ncbi:hypothetical protein PtA15_10A228 [Puccinia triticina]|uniref:Uncharacterized protein n=1 Tax=Puccinia triticina TaxID=208348 RepID=A0ABY7CU27_9BASI|nr:uncharacterized protein PtA15_10A228 [Puccinia triticina]WAQ88808.1 hypothetical protein PtA15_10A228 [Puccinia triticina]